jgi:3-deoxy-7-phosphoheptulonate synthase
MRLHSYLDAAPPLVSPLVDDLHVRSVRELVRPIDLLNTLPMSPAAAAVVYDARVSIGRVLAGHDPRLLVVVGPCSVHDVEATLAYAAHVKAFREAFGDRLLIVMRVYFEKPRTRGGWKGLINDPGLDGTFRINEGLRLARQLLLEINSMGVPTATEFVDPITPQYIGDLVSWAAIGARTAESPVHRELASGLSCPVAFKNGLTGDVRAAVNGAVVARQPQHFLGVTKIGTAAIVSTGGNPYAHIILRGGSRPNYDADSVRAAAALLEAEGLPPRLMVDCSHGNCQGEYRRQVHVAEEIARQRRAGGTIICGVMVESNLVEGKQSLVAGCRLVRGMSITDACLGIDETAGLLYELAGAESRVSMA